MKINQLNIKEMEKTELRTEFSIETQTKFNVEWIAYNDYAEWLEKKLLKLLPIPPVVGQSEQLADFAEMKEKLLKEIELFSVKYQFSFQFWGDGNNNVFISKDDVELYSSGGWLNIEDALTDAVKYIYRINRTPDSDRLC